MALNGFCQKFLVIKNSVRQKGTWSTSLINKTKEKKLLSKFDNGDFSYEIKDKKLLLLCNVLVKNLSTKI